MASAAICFLGGITLGVKTPWISNISQSDLEPLPVADNSGASFYGAPCKLGASIHFSAAVYWGGGRSAGELFLMAPLSTFFCKV